MSNMNEENFKTRTRQKAIIVAIGLKNKWNCNQPAHILTLCFQVLFTPKFKADPSNFSSKFKLQKEEQTARTNL